jgi:hypothetical protein
VCFEAAVTGCLLPSNRSDGTGGALGSYLLGGGTRRLPEGGIPWASLA